MIVQAGESETYGAIQQAGVQAGFLCSLEAESFFSRKPQRLHLRPLTVCMRPTHISQNILSCLKSTDCRCSLQIWLDIFQQHLDSSLIE